MQETSLPVYPNKKKIVKKSFAPEVEPMRKKSFAPEVEPLREHVVILSWKK